MFVMQAKEFQLLPRVFGQQAFQCLKSWWHWEHLTENIPYTVLTCVTLHNMCEWFGDKIS